MMFFSSIRTRLNLITITIFLIVSILTVFFVNFFQKQYAFATAEEKSLILLQHNLAIHTYFNQQLKPKIFALTDSFRQPDYFDPTWMSSTYAVRVIDKQYRQDSKGRYYYKEAAIDARSPENEADDFERDFILRLNRDQDLKKVSGVRTFDGKPYFFTLVRGESMDKGCLRCHSTPDKAPGTLVKSYGATRSFNRVQNEAISAISIRVPLDQAYRDADALSARLSVVLLLLLLATFVFKNRLINHIFLDPINTIRLQAETIASDPENLGTSIPQIYTREMNEIAGSFNSMSSRLRVVVDNLDKTVRERTAALTESEAKYRFLFENMTNGFALHEMIYDSQGVPCDYRFVEINSAFERLTGLKSSDIAGKTVLEIMPETEKAWIETYGKVAAEGEPISFENYSSALDSYYQVWAFCPKPGFFAAVFSNITERKQVEKELQNKNAELERFTYTVSHDLKSPLITIQSYAGMITKDIDKGEYERARADLKRIEGAAAKLMSLLNDLLELSRIGRVMNVPYRIDMNRLVRDTLEQLKGPLEQHEIEIAISQDLPAISGDRKRIAEVLQNLVENACKYMGDQSEPRIEIGCRKSGIEAVFYVSDNGKGIDPSLHESIFGLFYKLDPGSEGTGVGLALVKQIIEAHGGRVWVESEGAGLGSCFCFTIPDNDKVTVLS